MFYLTTNSTHLIYVYMVSVQLAARFFFMCTIPQDRIAHTTAFVTPVMEHWLEREIVLTTHHTMSKCSYHGATSRSSITMQQLQILLGRHIRYKMEMSINLL